MSLRAKGEAISLFRICFLNLEIAGPVARGAVETHYNRSSEPRLILQCSDI